MSNKKKLVFGVIFVIFLAVLWFATYFICLQIKPSGDNVVTKEQLDEMDKDEEVFYEGKIILSDKEYDLNEVTKDILKDNVVVQVKVGDQQVQGYVSFSDILEKPEIKLFINKNYAQVILPDKGDVKDGEQ